MQSFNYKKSFSIFILTLLFSFILIYSSFAKQFNVDVSNIKYTPKDITISVGDTVVWTNTQGSHNVNGSTSVFPSNPESFGNSVAGPGWTLTHVFSLPGTYDYRCDPHANFGMVGTVTVETQSEVNETQFAVGKDFNIYPNPAEDYFNIEFNDLNAADGRATIVISDIEGNEVQRIENVDSSIFGINTQLFAKGTYYINVLRNGKSVERKSVVIR